MSQQQIIQYAITAVVVLLVLALRLRGMSRGRRLRLETLWIVPIIYLVIVGAAIAQAPPQPSDFPWLIGAGLIGCAIGWYRGKMMRITVDPETHALNQQASPLFMLILVGIILLRYALRYALGAESAALGISVAALTDAPLVLVAGMFTLSRVEMYVRAQRLLAEARTAKAAGAPPA